MIDFIINANMEGEQDTGSYVLPTKLTARNKSHKGRGGGRGGGTAEVIVGVRRPGGIRRVGGWTVGKADTKQGGNR